MINIKKGMDLPLSGQPKQTVSDSPIVKQVALIANDYPGLRPSMAVEAGDSVKKGQILFYDKKNEGLAFTAPASGTVVAINRGQRRAFQSIVIAVNEDQEAQSFNKVASTDLLKLSSKEVVEQLVASGMWTSFRARPFDKIPKIDSLPHSIFVTAMDTNPLAPCAKTIIENDKQAFIDGINVISRLGDFKVYICKGDYDLPSSNAANAQVETFVGPHPAGLPGVHINRLDPVSEEKTVWHINYQDVIAIGHLFVDGEYYNKRIISIAGPMAREPRLVETIQGASIADLSEKEVNKSANGVRVISGSVLWGYEAKGPQAFLGRYHRQVSIIEEGSKNVFLGWLTPGFKQHSMSNSFISRLIKPSKFEINTAINGGVRPMVPIGMYEKVLPFDMEATMLLRAIEIVDVDQAKLLGVLELAEEDLALCTYVCPGKTDFGSLIRECLDKIELEG